MGKQDKSEQAKSKQPKSEQPKFPQITASSMELFFCARLQQTAHTVGNTGRCSIVERSIRSTGQDGFTTQDKVRITGVGDVFTARVGGG